MLRHRKERKEMAKRLAEVEKQQKPGEPMPLELAEALDEVSRGIAWLIRGTA